MSSEKRVLIYGGKGGLGTALVSHFKSNGWTVISVDLAANDVADANVLVNPADDWAKQETTVKDGVGAHLAGDKLDAILNMAGGWAGGSADSPDFVKNSDLMWKQSVWSSAISAAVAAAHLKAGGCLVLPGAKAALEGTPGMIGYGMAKAAVHQLVKSLAEPNSGLPQGSLCTAVLPITLDTPMNRKFMPDADFSSWTGLDFVAELLFKWSSDMTSRPKNGGLVQLVTKNGETSLICE